MKLEPPQEWRRKGQQCCDAEFYNEVGCNQPGEARREISLEDEAAERPPAGVLKCLGQDRREKLERDRKQRDRVREQDRARELQPIVRIETWRPNKRRASEELPPQVMGKSVLLRREPQHIGDVEEIGR